MVDLNDAEAVSKILRDNNYPGMARYVNTVAQELRLAREVVEAAKTNMGEFCGVTINYASDTTLKPFCEALTAYEQLKGKG